MVVMVAAFLGLEQDFLPQEDKGRLFALVITPNGSTSEFTDRQLRKAEAIIASVPEVWSYGAIVAPGFSGPGQASFGIVFVTFNDKSERRRSVQEIVNGPGGIAQRLFAEVEGVGHRELAQGHRGQLQQFALRVGAAEPEPGGP